ncbi:hypothetical protein NLP77_19010 [Escherichia coli]|nr:hypothetical protein [Escherichia coli]
MKVWLISQKWFWKLRTDLVRVRFILERASYIHRTSVFKAKSNAHVFMSFALVGLKNLLWVILTLFALGFVEDYIRNNTILLHPLSYDEKKFNIDQLRLYAQILTAIFSIYFATIGIILSTGYTRLRRDIIQMLTTEQVGNVYSRTLVLSAVFCLSATALHLFGVEPGLFVYAMGTLLTLVSSLALFPLGQRLFNFFDLNQLARSEILPRIARHIEGASNPKNSVSLANHHSKAAHLAFEQLNYIDDRLICEKVGLGDNLPALSNVYSALLLHYLNQKHRIDYQSYWFPRRIKHKQWFLAGDSVTSIALKTRSQLTVEEEPNYLWLENEIINRLVGHIELAFKAGDFKLGLDLISLFSSRILTYAQQFQFDIGIRELRKMKTIIEKAFTPSDVVNYFEEKVIKVGIADAWAALGSNLCLEMLRRMITFEKELEQFFKDDIWTETSLHTLPAFLPVELAFIVERIEFEKEIEGQRLSKPKYVQQLAVQKLLQQYSKILPEVCDFHVSMVPDFVNSLINMKMPEAATQVVLASLHNHLKFPHWFNELSLLLERYRKYEHYSEKLYALPEINIAEMLKQFVVTQDEAIAILGRVEIVGHIIEQEQDDELPDHFGQIYFELAEECIHALEQNDENKLSKVFPMFMVLSLLASDTKFVDPKLDINNEFRLHLLSSAINDLMSVLGFAILYSAYFDNAKLSKTVLDRFKSWLESVPNKQQYLKRMMILSNPRNFSLCASPRDMIRLNWKMEFERRARHDGFSDQMGMNRGKSHTNKVVREFLNSHSDASHLFCALEIFPQLEQIDFKIDYHVSELARRFGVEYDKDFE